MDTLPRLGVLMRSFELLFSFKLMFISLLFRGSNAELFCTPEMLFSIMSRNVLVFLFTLNDRLRIGSEGRITFFRGVVMCGDELSTYVYEYRGPDEITLAEYYATSLRKMPYSFFEGEETRSRSFDSMSRFRFLRAKYGDNTRLCDTLGALASARRS